MSEAGRDIESLHLVTRLYTRAWPKHKERPFGGPLEGIVHYARNCPRLRLLHLSSMWTTEKGLTRADLPQELHGLRMLVIPKVVLPLGKEEFSIRISEIVGSAFPLVASAFQPEQIDMQKNWAVMRDAPCCPECAGAPVEPDYPF